MAERAVDGVPAARVAALVLNWRQAGRTLACVRTLREHAPALTVWVLDNGSADGSAETLERELGGEADVVLARSGSNLGFCAGVNRGLAWAAEHGFDQVLLLNNDVRVGPGFLAPLTELLAADPGVVAVGPTLLAPDQRVWAQGGRLVHGPNLVRLRGRGRPPVPTTHGPGEVAFLPGACVLFRLDSLVAVGGLDESYFMYWEDVDVCLRLRARGGRCVWLPWVRVVHDAGASSGGGRSPLRKFLQAANAVRFLRAHGRPVHRLSWLVFELLALPAVLFTGNGPRAAWAKMCGVAAGVRGRALGPADVERWTRQGR